MKAVVLTLLGLVVATGLVSAHSAFLRSQPANGATLKPAPNEIRIWFSEPIRTALSTIEVHDASGKQVDRRNLHVDEKEPTLVLVSLPEHLPPGVYRVLWSAVAQDLHVAKGSFSFHIAP
ncbi:MAG TPA: copper resistance CopC family protein [Chthoniobacterales bacterium]|jgi:methionine-rich copper-binding protein CopC